MYCSAMRAVHASQDPSAQRDAEAADRWRVLIDGWRMGGERGPSGARRASSENLNAGTEVRRLRGAKLIFRRRHEDPPCRG